MKLKQARLMYKKAVAARIEAYKKRSFEREFKLFQSPSMTWFGIYQERITFESVPYRSAPIQGRAGLCYYWGWGLSSFGLLPSSLVLGGFWYLWPLFSRGGDPSHPEQPSSQPTTQPVTEEMRDVRKTGDSLGESSPDDLIALVVLVLWFCGDFIRFLVYGFKHGWMWKHCRQPFKNAYIRMFLIVFIVSLIVWSYSHSKCAALFNPLAILGVQCFDPLLAKTYLVETSVPETWDSDLETRAEALCSDNNLDIALNANVFARLYGKDPINWALWYLFRRFKSQIEQDQIQIDLSHNSLDVYFKARSDAKADDLAQSDAVCASMLRWLNKGHYKKQYEPVYDFSEPNFIADFLRMLSEVIGAQTGNASIQDFLSLDTDFETHTFGSDWAFNPVWLFCFWKGNQPDMESLAVSQPSEDLEVLFVQYEIEEMALTATDEALKELIEENDTIQKVSCSIQQCWKGAQQFLLERCSNRNVPRPGDEGDEEIGRAPFETRSKPSHS